MISTCFSIHYPIRMICSPWCIHFEISVLRSSYTRTYRYSVCGNDSGSYIVLSSFWNRLNKSGLKKIGILVGTINQWLKCVFYLNQTMMVTYTKICFPVNCLITEGGSLDRSTIQLFHLANNRKIAITYVEDMFSHWSLDDWDGKDKKQV